MEQLTGHPPCGQRVDEVWGMFAASGQGVRVLQEINISSR